MFFFGSRQVKSQTKQTNCSSKPVENILQILLMEPPCFIKSLIDCLEKKKGLSRGKKKYIFPHMAAEEFTFPRVRSFELPLQTQMQISLSSHLTHSLSLLSYEVAAFDDFKKKVAMQAFLPLCSDRHKFKLTKLSTNWHTHTRASMR